MSRKSTWEQAKKRIRTFARAKNPEHLSILQNPDDAETGEINHTQQAETLVAIDSPDDYHVHHPETLGIEKPNPKDPNPKDAKRK